ncbi:hypothetical protein PMX22_18670 [Clostridium butyricum]|jgi:hypothetical protein|uniref:hypothetical protein n=1 Tax=Clostridium butyricum TaxID=1492 RepID=UPI002330CEE0|nr:hypothetical protein [Clostridium butyricum]MDB2161816.1 hypothetical protein [Clostridium butyricum]
MKKDFNDFMQSINSKDWNLVIDSISKKIQGKTREESIILASILVNTTILKEYHEWMNK